MGQSNIYAVACSDFSQYQDNNQPEIRCPEPFPRPVVDLSTAWTGAPVEIVLDQGVLSEIWADMARTTLPSWLARAPRNFGSPNHGKLKADQWRTACLVNLVITLCRIWGGTQASQKHSILLRNYLSLVIAVRWATMRSTSHHHATITEEYLTYYVRSTVEVFSTRALVFNNHASFHIPECLRMFGPVHGWWAFPFERYNGVLQRYNTNSKTGELSFFRPNAVN
jgi:hypothetical protein